MNIFIDIETIPDQRPGAMEAARQRVKVPGNYSKPDTIAKYIDEHAGEEWRRTALDGAYGEVFCVCWSFAADDMYELTRDKDWKDPRTEGLLLEQMNERLVLQATGRRPHFIGHNLGFDLRFLFHRFVIHGIKPAFSIPYNATQWSGAYYDTMYHWAGLRNGIKLTDLACALGLPPGNDIDGSEVWDTVKAGRHDEVLAHCQADVERVREIHRRMTWQA